MYVVTFYSFKGGVGRTMALVNVAVELARRGRRVLVVDFDLEAPGLDTFDLPRPPGTTPGIIDFVSEYVDTGQAPDVVDFIFEPGGVGNDQGALWIMPSGAHRDSYAKTYADIDWGELYENHDGYLLFEDLKAQWKNLINPDYVLIDSRTGHTDIGGICTRQLPDAVVILFFPNVQNLRGLTKVVRDIRAERTEASARAIDLYFVMSNVPDLDDEDKILEQSIASFQNELGFGGEPLMIHHYDSLSLLNQVIFTKDRRRSRLAHEYGAVTAEIMRRNPADRDGALEFIAGIPRIRRPRGISVRYPADIDAHLKQIEASHKGDGEVLFLLGSLRADDGRSEDAVALFGSAIEAGYKDPDLYLRRADLKRWENDRDGASDDAREALQCAHVSAAQVRRALTMIQPNELARVADFPAVVALSPQERIRIASDFNRSRFAADTTKRMILPLIDDTGLSADDRTTARHEFILASIALGDFADALRVTRDEQCDIRKMSIAFAFNYGMAQWGASGDIIRDPFDHVVDIDRRNPRDDPEPNYLQCMAISYWAVDERDQARKALEGARRLNRTTHGRSFSCWRYFYVTRDQFELDLDDAVRLIDGDDTVRPRFITENDRTRMTYLVHVPDEWPTYHCPPDLWEELGRTIATFGFLEDVIKRAGLAVSYPGRNITEQDYKEWEQWLESSVSDPMGRLIDRFAKHLKPDAHLSQERITSIMKRLKSAAELGNALCHGAWTDYEPATGEATVRFFPRNDWRKYHEFCVSRSKLARIRRETTDITRELIGAVVSKGIQLPGSSSPGKPVIAHQPQ